MSSVFREKIVSIFPRYILTVPRRFIFVVSIIISTGFFLIMPDSYKSPTNIDYLSQLEALSEGRFFIDAQGNGLLKYPPVQSFVLYSLHRLSDLFLLPKQAVVSAFFILMLALCAALIYSIAALFSGEQNAFFPALLYMTHPYVLMGAMTPLSFVPFSVFLYLSVYFILKATQPGSPLKHLVLSFFFLAFGMLTRPIALFVPFILAGIFFFFQKQTHLRTRLIHLACATSVLFAVLLPWESFIYNRTGKILPLSEAGVYALRDGLSFNNKAYRHPLNLPTGITHLTNRFWESYSSFTKPGQIAEWVATQLREHPGAVISLFLYKAGRSWYGTDSQNPRKEGFNLLFLFIYMTPICYGILLHLRRSRKIHVVTALLVSLTLVFWSMTIIALSIVRYMVPIIGLLLIYIPECFRNTTGKASHLTFLTTRSLHS